MTNMATIDPEAIALIEGNRTLTYREMLEKGDKLCAAIEGRSLVFVVAQNSCASIAAYVGLLRHGHVPVMVNEGMSALELNGLVAAYDPEYLWAPQGWNDVSNAVVYEEEGYSLFALGGAQKELHPDLALCLSTSGSTGSPKLVRLSSKNLSANTRSIIEYLHIDKNERAITTLPFSYTYGISIINTHLAAGASIVLTNSGILERKFWDELNATKATTFGGVPYTYQMLKRLRFERMETPFLRYLTQAGGRLGQELHEFFARICQEKDIEFVVMYGQTEATARMSWLPPERTLDKVGSIGIAIPQGSFELRDGRNKIEESQVQGELVYKGPNVSMGYALSRDDLAKGDERFGVLETGDIAYRDDEGFYYITGRKKRFLKLFGNRVGLDEAESILASCGVTAACVGEDDRMEIFVEQGDPAYARTVLAERLSINPRAFHAQPIDSLPRSSSGKILYSALKDCHA